MKTTKGMRVVLWALLCLTTLATAKKSENVVNDESATVFDQEILRTYELTVAPDMWEHLNDNIIKEQYVPALLTVDGDTVGTVGIRYKGSTFTLEGCTGVRGGVHCSKISMKIKFNKFDKDLRFHGLKRLNFNSMMYDPSALRERLAYSIFREMGVVTSCAAHARLIINGEYRGLFSLVEQIDKEFVLRNFPKENDGWLFKEKWPVTSDTAFYVSGLKTKKSEPQAGAFVDLYHSLEKSDESSLDSVVAAFTDEEYLMRYMAVDRAVANWDGITGFYPLKDIDGIYASHNYYWYQPTDSSYFWILPWDLDGTMSTTTGFDHVPAWNDQEVDCDSTYSIFEGETTAKAPTCDPFMKGWALLGEQNGAYKKAQKEVLKGPFSKGALEAKVDQWSNQIELSVAEDNYGPKKAVWDFQVENMRDNVKILRQRLENDLNDVKESPFTWSFDKSNGFEKLDSYDFLTGMYQHSNLKSCVRISLNDDKPLSGKTDLRIDFDMYNESQDAPFGQWVWVGSTFGENQEIDFIEKGIVGIRFTTVSDKERDFWVSFGSKAFREADGGIQFGNSFPVGTEPTTVEFYFKDGRFPFWATAPEEFTVDQLLKRVVNLNLSPEVQGRQENGLFAPGDHDRGFVLVDDIEFIVEK